MKISTLESWSWPARIRWAKKADKAGRYEGTEQERFLCEEAEDWQTCACGKLDPRIPRLVLIDARPEDDKLVRLGVDFVGFIASCDWPQALSTIAKIEQRAAEIIAEIEASQ